MAKRSPRCTSRTIWVAGRKHQHGQVHIWCTHPVTGELVRIRHWKDLRDLEAVARRRGVLWDHRVAYLTGIQALTDADVEEARRALSGEESSCEVSYADAHTLRGHNPPLLDQKMALKAVVQGDALPLTMTQLAWSLLGTRATKATVRALKDALSVKRTGAVALSVAASHALTSDEVLEALQDLETATLDVHSIDDLYGHLPRLLLRFPGADRLSLLHEIADDPDPGRLARRLDWTLTLGVVPALRMGNWVAGIERAGAAVNRSRAKARLHLDELKGLDGRSLGELGVLTHNLTHQRGEEVIVEQVQLSFLHGTSHLALPRDVGQIHKWGLEVGGIEAEEGDAYVAIMEADRVLYLASLHQDEDDWTVRDVRGRGPVPSEILGALSWEVGNTSPPTSVEEETGEARSES